MNERGLITLLTDFGLDDPYVGVMKAVLLRHFPAAQIVDLSHAIAPYDRLAAAFWIERVWSWFPPRTVHVVVVDPGVGSTRRALVISAHGQLFVGPDNGVLSGIWQLDPHAEAREVAATALGFGVPSRTFHGRDVFAPIAARLADGSLAFEGVGDEVTSLCEGILPAAIEANDGSSGQVVTIDRFGNALTNLLVPTGAGRYEALAAGLTLPVLETYADGAIGQIFALFGAFGTLELAMREGHAARALGIGPGMPVVLRRIS